MPIIWRYLIGEYLKVLFLCMLSFIALLLVSRLEEIAEFATWGTSGTLLVRFVLYQIPYILPLALPLSCLISAMILFQKLSHTQELTAFRSCGISLFHILFPLLMTSAFLSLGNFFITSELATTSHLATRRMAYTLASTNPLILVQNAKIAKLKGAYIQMDPVKTGESARDLIVAVYNRPQNRLNLLTSKALTLEEGELMAKQVSLISASDRAGFDTLIIENQAEASGEAPEFAHLLRKRGWKIAWDHLTFPLLRARLHSLKSEGSSHALQKGYSEITRRLSLGIAPFTYTLLGLAFGMGIGRRHSRKGIFIVLALSALSLIAFFAGKELDHLFLAASSLYLLPHVVIVSVSMHTLNRLQRGIE